MNNITRCFQLSFTTFQQRSTNTNLSTSAVKRANLPSSYISSDIFGLLHLPMFEIHANNRDPWINSNPTLILPPPPPPFFLCPNAVASHSPTTSALVLPRGRAVQPEPRVLHRPRAATCEPCRRCCQLLLLCRRLAPCPRWRRSSPPPLPKKKLADLPPVHKLCRRAA